MTPTIRDVLVEAIEDEIKACANYRAVIAAFGEVRPFSNIVASEGRHIRALTMLFDRYGLAVPPDTWATRVTPPASLREACEEAVRAEIDNAAMYDRLIEASTGFADVQTVLERLRRASQDNHLPAFRRCAARAAGVRGGAGPGRRRRFRGGRPTVGSS